MTNFDLEKFDRWLMQQPGSDNLRMKNMQYLKGYRFELEVKSLLQEKGWTVVRSSGSHGVIDLVAISPNKKIAWLIQCKHKKTMSKEVKEGLLKLCPVGSPFVPIYAYREKRREPVFINIYTEEEVKINE